MLLSQPIASFGDLLLFLYLQVPVWRWLRTANTQKDDFWPAEFSTG